MRNTSMFAILIGGCLLQAAAQATRSTIDPLLKQPLDNPILVDEQLRHFMLKRVPELPSPRTPEDWQTEADRLRAHEQSVIYHGWPQAWVDAKPKFEKVAEIARPGYRIVKFRYEIVPGFHVHRAAVRARAYARQDACDSERERPRRRREGRRT